MNKFHLPKLESIKINDFDLYTCPLDISFNKQLNIIFGTNGTGKSTLLYILLYSIIGPYIGSFKVKSQESKRKETRPIMDDVFFRNRMHHQNRSASVSASFTVGDALFNAEHSLYDNKLIRASCNGKEIEGKSISYRTFEAKYSNREELSDYLISNYQQKIVEHSLMPGGMNTLISMALDIMFFTEDRKFTFWQTSLQELIIGKYIVNSELYSDFEENKRQTKYFESEYKKRSEMLNYLQKIVEEENRAKLKVSSVVTRGSEKDILDLIVELDDKIDLLKKNAETMLCEFRKYSQDALMLKKEHEIINEQITKLENEWYSNLFPKNYNTYFSKFNSSMLKDICPICGNNHVFNVQMENCILCNEALSVNKSVDLVNVDIARRERQIDLKHNIENQTNMKKKCDRLQQKNKEIGIEIMDLEAQRKALEFDKDKQVKDADFTRKEKLRAEKNDVLDKLNQSKEGEREKKKVIEENLERRFQQFSASFEMFAKSFYGENHKVQLQLPFSFPDEHENSSLITFSLDEQIRSDSIMLS